MGRRNTRQRELVLDAVRSLRGHVTADEVYAYVLKEHPTVGKGTVYRNLNILSEENEIKKIEIPEGPNRFDFNLKEHYHVICVKCNRVYDVDMEVLQDLKNKIQNTHGIQFLDYDIVFKGVCSDCRCMTKQEAGYGQKGIV